MNKCSHYSEYSEFYSWFWYLSIGHGGFAKYLFYYSPRNIWRESFLWKILNISRQNPLPASKYQLCYGFWHSETSQVLDIFICCYCKSVKVIKGQHSGKEKGWKVQAANPPLPSLMNYGAAAVSWRSWKLMVLSGLVLARLSAHFYPSRYPTSCQLCWVTWLSTGFKTARGRKNTAFNVQPHIIGPLTTDQVHPCCCGDL